MKVGNRPLVHSRPSVFDCDISQQKNKRDAGEGDHRQKLKAVYICQ